MAGRVVNAVGATGRDWTAIMSLSAIVAVAFGVMLYAPSVLLTDSAAGAEFSVTVLSAAFGGSVLVGGLLAYPVGRWGDRHGMRGVIGAGPVLGGLGLAAFAAAAAPWHMLAASWLLLGPAISMCFYEPAFIAINQWFPGSHRSRSLAVLTVAGGLSAPVFIPLTSALVAELGWRWAAGGLGGLLWLTGALAYRGLPHTGPDPSLDAGSSSSKPEPPAGGGTDLSGVLREPRFLLFTTATILGFASLQAVLFHRLAAFEDSGATLAAVSAWAALSGLLSFPGRWTGPFLAERIGGHRVLTIELTLLAVAVGFASLGGAGLPMTSHFVIFGLAFGPWSLLRALVMAEWYSGPRYGRIMGAQWSMAAVAGAVGPPIVGAYRDAVGSYTAPLAAVAVALLLAAGLTWASKLAGRNAGPR